MNIDPNGLKSIYSEAQNVGKTFLNAIGIITSITTPTAASSGYKQSIATNLLICSEDAIKMLQELKLYINAIEEANLSVEKEVEAVTEGGTFDKILNFLGSLFDNAAMQKARETEASLLASAALVGMFDEEMANEMVNASQMVLDEANKIMEQKTGSQVISTGLNSLIAGLKGLMRFGESAVDGMIMAGTQMSNTDMINSVYGLAALIDPNILNVVNELARENEKGAMELVENNYTDEAFNKLYKEEILKRINEKSYIKHGDMAYMVIEGVTYYIPMAVVDSLAPGSGTALNYFAGSGRAAQETLTQMKLDSKEGIESEYKAGNIPHEVYDMYNTIWNMSDEEFHKLRLAHTNGEISEEEYQNYEAIRNMNIEWTTTDNFNKSNAIGATSGLWEATQWQVGKVLNGLKRLGNSKILASLTRTGTDTIFNGLDTPFRSLVSTLAMDSSLAEEFETRGGWESVGRDVAIGMIATLGGELIDEVKNEIKKHKVLITDEQKSAAIEESRRIMYDFREKNNYMINLFDIDNALAKVEIFNTRAEFEAKYIELTGDKSSDIDVLGGFCYNKKAYIPPEHATPDVIIHEANHVMSTYHCYPEVKVSPGMVEAITEKITLDMMGRTDVGDSSYGDSVACMREIIDVLSQKGYEKVDLNVQFSFSPINLYFEEITGTPDFYSDVCRCMDVMNISSSSKKQYMKAYFELQAMCEKLKEY